MSAALDPAGPEFYNGNLSRRITPEDADFVDALHTNAGILGLLKDVGQVDFYLNGGTQQPGCFSYGSFLTSVKASATGTGEATCFPNCTEIFQVFVMFRSMQSPAGSSVLDKVNSGWSQR